MMLPPGPHKTSSVVLTLISESQGQAGLGDTIFLASPPATRSVCADFLLTRAGHIVVVGGRQI